MYVAVTGHRPDKIFDWNWVEARLLDAFDITGVTFLYQGQAAGVDLTAAKLAYRQGIAYAACKPWKGQKAPKDWQARYDNGIRYAAEVIDVDPSEEFKGNWMYFQRNEFMVDAADKVIAVWDGTQSGSGHAVKYARKTDKPVWRINPRTHEVGWHR
jgi:uncharacterized phage-like protein YoqJ